jgi:hypothetical protein
MNPLLSFAPKGPVETFLKKWGLWLLLAFALCYYGYYFNVWPGPYGEGGLVAVIAQRLMEGQRPIVDTFLGYNVLWFYPVVAVFKLVGPSYIALRLLFFGLSLATGLMGWSLMRACTGRAWPAFLAGLLMIGLPGQMYRNYMAFLVILNMAAFVPAYVLADRGAGARLVWMGLSGVTLGIAYLTRVDLGFFISFILLGLILIFPFTGAGRESFRVRLALALGGMALAATGIAATHLLVWNDARTRGYSEAFATQYVQWPQMIAFNALRMAQSVSEECRSTHHAPPPAPATPAGESSKPTPSSTSGASTSVSTTPPAAKLTGASLDRPHWKDPGIRRKIFWLNVYLPLPCAILIALLGFWAWCSGLFFHDTDRSSKGLALLTSLGFSLTLFPQYFWWRPDMVHLSEFMVPMIFTLILSFVVAGTLFGKSLLPGRILCAACLIVGSSTLALYANNGFQSGSSGGIAVSQYKSVMFHALNGVDVRMMPAEKELNTALFTIVTAASEHGEPVICYPYNPEINFMTDRPSYEWNLYADNDLPADQFCARETALMEKHRPPVIVINNWDINGTEESRFPNWASALCRKIASGYTLVFRGDNFEVYVRPDRVNRIPERFRTADQTAPAH